MAKLISTSLSPNTEPDDAVRALGIIFSPWKWKKGSAVRELENKFGEKFGFKNAYAFNSGRSCLMAILSAARIGQGDEVIVQSFTCNAVINPILSAGARPVFVDIGSDLNMDAEKLEEKINEKTRAVIVQHTFGWPADAERIKAVCEKYKILVIEDCAHALGAKKNGKYCGSAGDAAFFSFGRDKVISSVYGGMLIINNPDLIPGVEAFYSKTGNPSGFWIFQQLFHPVIMEFLVLPLYNFLNLGKIFLALAMNFNLLSKSVTPQENEGNLPDYFPAKMPNGLAILTLKQLQKLERFNRHRQELASFYMEKIKGANLGFPFGERENLGAIYMRFPVLVENPKEIFKKMRENGIYLNDGWCDSPIVPAQTSLLKMCYENGSCLFAEETVKHIISLPTSIKVSAADAERIVYLLKSLIAVKI
ncbi:MAG: aminotransferase class V-fold PLP-dependent enzyme [Candidatus Pacebacteria bacterium]|nr:aminotransferase class V-fold PLP-dependent enzyme [Candidatus Paceibacterota bacterium]